MTPAVYPAMSLAEGWTWVAVIVLGCAVCELIAWAIYLAARRSA